MASLIVLIRNTKEEQIFLIFSQEAYLASFSACSQKSISPPETFNNKRELKSKVKIIPNLTSIAFFKEKAVLGYDSGHVTEMSWERFLNKYQSQSGLFECPNCKKQQTNIWGTISSFLPSGFW